MVGDGKDEKGEDRKAVTEGVYIESLDKFKKSKIKLEKTNEDEFTVTYKTLTVSFLLSPTKYPRLPFGSFSSFISFNIIFHV